MQPSAAIREVETRDGELIRREVLTSWQPAVLRGLAAGWRSVELGRSSPPAIVD